MFFWLQESWSVSISQGKKALERLCHEAYGGHPSQDQCAANCLGFRDPVLSSGSVFLAKKVTDRWQVYHSSAVLNQETSVEQINLSGSWALQTLVFFLLISLWMNSLFYPSLVGWTPRSDASPLSNSSVLFAQRVFEVLNFHLTSSHQRKFRGRTLRVHPIKQC